MQKERKGQSARRKGSIEKETTTNLLGVLHREQQRFEEAESLLSQALDGRQRKLGNDHPATLESMHDIGKLNLEQGQYEEAEAKLIEAYEGRTGKLGPEHPHTGETVECLVKLYEAWGKPAKAKEWQAKLPR